MTRSKTGWLFLVSAFVLALAGVTPVVYAHGGDPTLIHACFNKSSGEIKIVSANASCKNNEIAVDWPGTSAVAVGLDPAALVGTWRGSRFVGQFGTGVFIEEPGQLFTFNADGTFTAGTHFLPSGHYRLVGQTIVAGTIALQDAQINGDTLTFYTDNRTSGQLGGSTLGQAVVYVLQRTP